MIKLEFIEEGRSGYVIYRGAEIKLELYFEFGSNNSHPFRQRLES